MAWGTVNVQSKGGGKKGVLIHFHRVVPNVKTNDYTVKFHVPGMKELWYAFGEAAEVGTNYVASFYIDNRLGYAWGRKWTDSSDISSTSGTLSATLDGEWVTLRSGSSSDILRDMIGSATYVPCFVGESLSGEDEYTFIVKTLTSSDAGTTFVCKKDPMTWGEWVTSDYNTAGIYAGADGLIYQSDGTGIYTDNMMSNQPTSSDIISPMKVYLINW